jgi:hypothetical protein
MKLECSRQILENSNIKFHENPSSACRDFPCGQTDTTKVTVAIRNFANAPKNKCIIIYVLAEPFGTFRLLQMSAPYTPTTKGLILYRN